MTVPSGTSTTIPLAGDNTGLTALTFGIPAGETPDNGTLSALTNLGGVNPTNATVIYTPDGGFQGPDEFIFSVSAGSGFDCAAVFITVLPPPPPTTAPSPPAGPSPSVPRLIGPVTATTTSPTRATGPLNGETQAAGSEITTTPTIGTGQRVRGSRPSRHAGEASRHRSRGGLVGFLDGTPHRSQLVSSVTPPDALVTTAKHLVYNFSLALLFVLLSWLPAEIINDVLKERHDQLAERGRVTATRFPRLDAWAHALPTALRIGIFVVIGALIYGFLDPGFGFNATSLVLLAAIAAALVTITLAHELIHGWDIQRRNHLPYRLETLPLGLALAAILVVFSRLAHFQPGYTFGLVCGVLFLGRVEDRDDGRSLAVATIATLALGVAAWVIWTPIRDAALRPHPSVEVLFLDALLACVWVFALQTVVFSLVPLHVLAGAKIRQWNRAGWLALYVLSMFVFVEAVVHSSKRYGGSSEASVWSMLIIFLAFSGAALVFWVWFQLSQRRAGHPGTDEPVEVT